MAVIDRWSQLSTELKLLLAVVVGVPLFVAVLMIGSALIYAGLLLA